MDTHNSPADLDREMPGKRAGNASLLRVIQIASWIINLLFLTALLWAIFQAVINRNPLPAWAWLGMLALFAAAVGLVVLVAVYRGVSRQAGPLDFSPSGRIAGELKSESKRIAVDGARALKAEITMLAGVLSLAGDATGGVQTTFAYDDADWLPPQVDYFLTGDSLGELGIAQKATGRLARKPGRCEWDIRLNRDLPIDLKVKFGAGKADLRLAGLHLTGLQVQSGVGELDVDLSGPLEHNLEAYIKSGIGDTRLRLPKEAGVRLHSSFSFGSLQVPGMEWDGKAYTNVRYRQAGARLDIYIEGGMGKVSVL